MTASDVNLSAIINIKHRAIIQSLISTNLNITEIAAKLQTTTGSIYYAVGRYLYKGYLEQRAREIELKNSRAVLLKEHRKKKIWS